jgi:hypothetical protein
MAYEYAIWELDMSMWFGLALSVSAADIHLALRAQ